MLVKIYHNARCSKSRDACTILAQKGVKPQIIEYLKTPLTAKELKQLLKLLGIRAEELVRKKEPLYKTFYEGKTLSEAQWIKALIKHPILIERPIIVKDNKAIIGRPTEKIKALFN